MTQCNGCWFRSPADALWCVVQYDATYGLYNCAGAAMRRSSGQPAGFYSQCVKFQIIISICGAAVC